MPSSVHRSLSRAAMATLALLAMAADGASAAAHRPALAGSHRSSARITPQPRSHRRVRQPRSGRGRPTRRLLGVIPVRGHRRRHGFRARAAADSLAPLTYHGGAVMHSNNVHAIYWYPAGYTPPAGYTAGVNRYFTDVAADSGRLTNVYASDAQYQDSKGRAAYASTFQGSLVDTQPFPASDCTNPKTAVCLSGDALNAEVNRVINAQHWPRGLSNVYFILTPADVGSCDADPSVPSGTACSFVDYCAYHTSSGSGSSTTLWANMPYAAFDPGCRASQSPQANPALDSEASILSHEHNEVITDPNGGGWFDTASGDENGDRCYTSFGNPLGSTGAGASSRYNQQINGHFYWLQEEWSNASSSCVQTMTAAVPTLALAVPPTVTAGVPATLTATASPLAGNSVSPTTGYRWDFGDGTSAVSAGPVQTHTFSATGTANVSVTATESPDGQTAFALAPIEVTAPAPPVADFDVSNAAPRVGQTITFTSSSSGPGVAGGSYSWDFGDGTRLSSTGPVQTHAYTTAGARTVTLRVAGSGGTSALSLMIDVQAAARPLTAAVPGPGGAPVASARPAEPPSATVLAPRPGVGIGQGLLVLLAPGAARHGRAALTVSRATARRLHLRRSVGIATFTITRGAPGRVRLHLTPRARWLLAHRHHFRVTLRLVLTDTRGHTTVLVRTFAL